MTIETKRTQDVAVPFVKALIAGYPGAGKTLFCSTWPEVYYASAEGGLLSVWDRNLPYTEIGSSDDLNQLRAILSQPPEFHVQKLGVEVQTIVIDTIDEVARILMRERMLKDKKDQFTLQDYGWLGDQLRTIIRGFRNLDMHVIFTTHIKADQDDAGRVTIKPQIAGAVADEIAAHVDIAGLIEAQIVPKVIAGTTTSTLERTLQTMPDRAHSWLKDRRGRLPGVFTVDFDTDWERMSEWMFGADKVSRAPVQKIEVPVESPAEAQAEAQVVEEPTQDNTGDTQETSPVSQEIAQAPEPEVKTATPEPKTDVVTPAKAVAKPPAKSTKAEPKAVAVEKSAPDTDKMVCEECGGVIESLDQAQLSHVRFRRRMCRTCFVSAKTAKK